MQLLFKKQTSYYTGRKMLYQLISNHEFKHIEMATYFDKVIIYIEGGGNYFRPDYLLGEQFSEGILLDELLRKIIKYA